MDEEAGPAINVSQSFIITQQNLEGWLEPCKESKISRIVCSSNMVESHVNPAIETVSSKTNHMFVCEEMKPRTHIVEKFLSCQIAMYEVPEANSWFKRVRVAGQIIALS